MQRVAQPKETHNLKRSGAVSARCPDQALFIRALRNLHGIAALVAALLLAPSVTAQTYDIRTFGIDEGLPQAEVNHMIQDSRGHLVVATNGGGAALFDGSGFAVIGMAEGLPDVKVTHVAAGPDGSLWLAHPGHGLSRGTGQAPLSFSALAGLPSQQVNTLLADGDSVLWAGTFGGLCAVRGKDLRLLTKADGLPSDDIRAICRDRAGALWVGTYGGGVARLDNGTFVPFGIEAGLTDGFISDLFLARDGRMLVATASGVLVWDGQSFAPLRNAGAVRVNAMAEDAQGNIWLATPEGALMVGDLGRELLSDRNGLPHPEVLSICIDREQNIWFGTRKGLARLAHRAMAHFAPQGRPALEPSAFGRLPDGTLVLTDRTGGALRIDGNAFIPIVNDADVASHPFSSLATGADGRLWLGTSDFGGLFSISDGKVSIYSDEPGLMDNSISALVTGADSRLIIGTPGGLSYFDGDRFVPGPSDLGHITALTPTVGSDVLVGTLSGAVLHLHADRADTVHSAKVPITALVAMPDGRKAIGTDGEGVVVIGKESRFAVTEADGLTSRFVRSLVWDGRHLWAGTAKGVSRLLLGADSAQVLAITQAHGFSGSECLPGALMTDGDMLWVGTIKGVTRINKSLVGRDTVQPVVFLTSVQLLLQEVNSGAGTSALPHSLDLGHDDNHLRFSFKAISLTNPELITYRWRLVGYDVEWNEGSSGVANYPNLPHGEYVFEVVACNSDGVCTEAPVQFSFRIRPPFWKTVWFYVVVAFAVMTTVVLWVRWRERRLLALNRELEDKVDLRTRELKEQRDLVEEKNRHITEGIEYARNIQMAILPSASELDRAFSEHFVIYMPKDTVGGDFYWAYTSGTVTWAVAADCTGHGVAGAFMSMIGSDLLNQLIIEQGATSPAAVLRELDRGIKLAFAQSAKEFENDQGMDVAMVRLDRASRHITFAGAMRPLLVVGQEVNETEGDRHTISSAEHGPVAFTDRSITLAEGETVYIYSDGLCDQFGGPRGKKFGSKQLRELIAAMNGQPLAAQHDALLSAITAWKGQEPQQDDIMILAFRP
jgi:ligand-binding sensor domain-containing protein/serine phosphatase RsbU (regulator of sigma subunit)